MGLAVLPARLKEEMALLKTAILENKDVKNDAVLEKHFDWTEEIKAKYTDINSSNIDKIIEDEIGLVFSKVLSHAGVFKNTQDFLRFTDSIK
jgi:UDPglucose--hexose-1-phosphate uridylyltransferase